MHQEIDILAYNYITKLRIISKIESGGKLNTINNKLDIYKNGIKNWLKRNYYGDGRKQTVLYLKHLYKEIRLFSNSLINNIHYEKESLDVDRKLDLLISLAEQIRESIIGIKNLKETYKNCPRTLASLECIENDCALTLYKYIKLFIPKDKYTEILKKPIILDVETIKKKLTNQVLHLK